MILRSIGLRGARAPRAGLIWRKLALAAATTALAACNPVSPVPADAGPGAACDEPPPAGWTRTMLEPGPAEQFDCFDPSVAIAGDTVLLGARRGVIGDGPGAAFTFRKAGEWTQESALASTDPAVLPDGFGSAVLPLKQADGLLFRLPDGHPERARPQASRRWPSCACTARVPS